MAFNAIPGFSLPWVRNCAHPARACELHKVLQELSPGWRWLWGVPENDRPDVAAEEMEDALGAVLPTTSLDALASLPPMIGDPVGPFVPKLAGRAAEVRCRRLLPDGVRRGPGQPGPSAGRLLPPGERQGRRTLGRIPGHAEDRRQRQRHVLSPTAPVCASAVAHCGPAWSVPRTRAPGLAVLDGSDTHGVLLVDATVRDPKGRVAQQVGEAVSADGRHAALARTCQRILRPIT